MQCNQCGATVRPGSKLCSNCGARLDGGNTRQGGRGGKSDYQDTPHPPSRTWRDEPGERSRRDSRSGNPDPMADPRAPRFLKGPVSSPRRDDRIAPPSRGGRSGGDDRRGDYQDYSDRGAPPRPERRGAAYDNRYDEGDSAEYSAEMSAEYSAEMSAEYPDPRGYNQRGAANDPRVAPLEMRDSGRGRHNSVQPDYGDRRSAAGPPQVYKPQDRYDPHDEYDPRDRYDARDRRNGPGPAEDGWDNPPSRTARGRGATGWESLERDEYAPFQTQNRPGIAGDTQTGIWQKSHPSPGKKRRTALFLVAAIVVLAVIAGAVGVLLKPQILSRLHAGTTATDNAPPFVTYTPGPTPTPPANFTEFDSTHSLYVVDYPKGWSESSSTSGSGNTIDYVDAFTRATPAASLTVEQAGAFSTITRAEIIQAEIQGAEGSGRTFSPLANPITTMEIAGEQWLRNDYLVSEPGGLKFHMTILACHHSQLGYAIVLVSLLDNFSQDSQTAFEPILNSFHFER